MSRWDRWNWYEPKPKRPPPKHGIKVKKTGSTWWGKRWIDALEHLSAGYSSRLSRGRSYARAGRAHDLEVKAGNVAAKVTGSRAEPYEVRITLATLRDAVWTKAIAAMAGKAQFSAELLAGQMPQDVDAAFKEAGASLFPRTVADLKTDCSCPDWANPCKHVAATHYVLGEAFDRDPFLLFELRGRTKAQVFAALRAARGGDELRAAPSARGRRRGRAAAGEREIEHREQPISGASLREVSPADYDKIREPLPSLRLELSGPPVSCAVLRQLGEPAAWSGAEPPAQMFGPAIRAAADLARRIALAEPQMSREQDEDAA